MLVESRYLCRAWMLVVWRFVVLPVAWTFTLKCHTNKEIIKITVGHVSTSTRPSAMALPGSRVSGAL
jgi:hypothetical protein